MANTYYSLTIHCVFSTRNREPSITEQVQERLWQFMGGILRQTKVKALSIGGTANHVHVLISLPSTLSVAKAVQSVKGSSSKWIHETFPQQQDFGWQRGYGAFSVGISHIGETVKYIQNQVENHRVKSFEEEYLTFLRRHQIDYDERYLWL